MSTFTVTPNSYTLPSGVMLTSGNPITDAGKRTEVGDELQLSPGNFRRFGRFKLLGDRRVVTRGAPGAAPWTPQRSRIKRDLLVGSSDAIVFGRGDKGYTLLDLDVEGDDRAGIFLEGDNSNIHLERVNVNGFGPGPVAAEWETKPRTLWGISSWYGVGDYTEVDCKINYIREEHAHYFRGRTGDVYLEKVIARYCGRTFFQDVARTTEGPASVGDLTFEGCEAYEMCLEKGGGGSSYSLRGGAPNTAVVLRNGIVKNGCDPAIIDPWKGSVSGCFVMDSGGGAWPGGYKELLIDNYKFQMGLVSPGAGQSRRPNVKISNVGPIRIDGNTLIENGPDTNPIALEIQQPHGLVRIGPGVVVKGRVIYDGTLYPDLAALKVAAPLIFV